MRTAVEINEALLNPPLAGIIVKATGATYMHGENPYYDMQMANYVLWEPENGHNWYGFIRDDYEPIYKNNAKEETT